MWFNFLKKFEILVNLLALFVLIGCFSGLRVNAMKELSGSCFLGESEGLKSEYYLYDLLNQENVPDLVGRDVVLSLMNRAYELPCFAKGLCDFDGTEIRGLLGPKGQAFADCKKAEGFIREELQNIKKDSIFYTVFHRHKEIVLGYVILQFFDLNPSDGGLTSSSSGKKAVQLSMFFDKDAMQKEVSLEVVRLLCNLLRRAKDVVAVNINCWKTNRFMVTLINRFIDYFLFYFDTDSRLVSNKASDRSFIVPVGELNGCIYKDDFCVGLVVKDREFDSCFEFVGEGNNKENKENKNKLVRMLGNLVGERLSKRLDSLSFDDVFKKILDLKVILNKDGFRKITGESK